MENWRAEQKLHENTRLELEKHVAALLLADHSRQELIQESILDKNEVERSKQVVTNFILVLS